MVSNRADGLVHFRVGVELVDVRRVEHNFGTLGQDSGKLQFVRALPSRPDFVIHGRDLLDHQLLGRVEIDNVQLGRQLGGSLIPLKEAMESTGLAVDDVSQFICHQSNIRIIESAKEKLGLPDDKVYINIDRYGNSSAGSVGLCFDELRRAGKAQDGETVVFVAFGGGLTWTSSVWRL